MQLLRWVIGALLFLVLLLFALQNSDPVTLRFYHWWSWQAPLVFVVLLAFAVGAACGLLAGALRAARLKRQLARSRRGRTREKATTPPRDAVSLATPVDGV